MNNQVFASRLTDLVQQQGSEPLNQVADGLSISEWSEAVRRFDDITQICAVDDLPVLVEALKRHKGNDPAPVSILWLWVTGRVTQRAKEDRGLWVWRRVDQKTEREDYLVCASNPDRRNEIMIFSSHTSVEMAAVFINALPFPAGGYSIVRVPKIGAGGSAADALVWESLREQCSSAYRYTSEERDLDYYFPALLLPTAKLAGRETTANGKLNIYINREVENPYDGDFMIDPVAAKESLKDGLKSYQNEINKAFDLVTAEELDPNNELLRCELMGFVRKFVAGLLERKIRAKEEHLGRPLADDEAHSIRNDHVLRKSYEEYYEATFESFQQLKTQCLHPISGERFMGYVFRRKDGKKEIVGFRVLEGPLGDNTFAYGVSSLALTDEINGVPGITSFMLRHTASVLME